MANEFEFVARIRFDTSSLQAYTNDVRNALRQIDAAASSSSGRAGAQRAVETFASRSEAAAQALPEGPAQNEARAESRAAVGNMVSSFNERLPASSTVRPLSVPSEEKIRADAQRYQDQIRLEQSRDPERYSTTANGRTRYQPPVGPGRFVSEEEAFRQQQRLADQQRVQPARPAEPRPAEPVAAQPEPAKQEPPRPAVAPVEPEPAPEPAPEARPAEVRPAAVSEPRPEVAVPAPERPAEPVAGFDEAAAAARREAGQGAEVTRRLMAQTEQIAAQAVNAGSVTGVERRLRSAGTSASIGIDREAGEGRLTEQEAARIRQLVAGLLRDAHAQILAAVNEVNTGGLPRLPSGAPAELDRVAELRVGREQAARDAEAERAAARRPAEPEPPEPAAAPAPIDEPRPEPRAAEPIAEPIAEPTPEVARPVARPAPVAYPEEGWSESLKTPVVREARKRQGWLLSDEDAAAFQYGNVAGRVRHYPASEERGQPERYDTDVNHAGERFPLGKGTYASAPSAMNAIERYVKKYLPEAGQEPSQEMYYAGDEARPRWQTRPIGPQAKPAAEVAAPVEPEPVAEPAAPAPAVAPAVRPPVPVAPEPVPVEPAPAPEPVAPVAPEPVAPPVEPPVAPEPVAAPVAALAPEPVATRPEPVPEPVPEEPIPAPPVRRRRPAARAAVEPAPIVEPAPEPAAEAPVPERLPAAPVAAPVAEAPVSAERPAEPVAEPVAEQPIAEPKPVEPVAERAEPTVERPLAIPEATSGGEAQAVAAAEAGKLTTASAEQSAESARKSDERVTVIREQAAQSAALIQLRGVEERETLKLRTSEAIRGTQGKEAAKNDARFERKEVQDPFFEEQKRLRDEARRAADTAPESVAGRLDTRSAEFDAQRESTAAGLERLRNRFGETPGEGGEGGAGGGTRPPAGPAEGEGGDFNLAESFARLRTTLQELSAVQNQALEAYGPFIESTVALVESRDRLRAKEVEALAATGTYVEAAVGLATAREHLRAGVDAERAADDKYIEATTKAATARNERTASEKIGQAQDPAFNRSALQETEAGHLAGIAKAQTRLGLPLEEPAANTPIAQLVALQTALERRIKATEEAASADAKVTASATELAAAQNARRTGEAESNAANDSYRRGLLELEVAQNNLAATTSEERAASAEVRQASSNQVAAKRREEAANVRERTGEPVAVAAGADLKTAKVQEQNAQARVSLEDPEAGRAAQARLENQQRERIRNAQGALGVPLAQPAADTPLAQLGALRQSLEDRVAASNQAALADRDVVASTLALQTEENLRRASEAAAAAGNEDVRQSALALSVAQADLATRLLEEGTASTAATEGRNRHAGARVQQRTSDLAARTADPAQVEAGADLSNAQLRDKVAQLQKHLGQEPSPLDDGAPREALLGQYRGLQGELNLRARAQVDLEGQATVAAQARVRQAEERIALGTKLDELTDAQIKVIAEGTEAERTFNRRVQAAGGGNGGIFGGFVRGLSSGGSGPGGALAGAAQQAGFFASAGLTFGAFGQVRQSLAAAEELNRQFKLLQVQTEALGQGSQFGQFSNRILAISQSTGVAGVEVTALAQEFLGLYQNVDLAGSATQSAAQIIRVIGESAATAGPQIAAIAEDLGVNVQQVGDAILTVQDLTGRSAKDALALLGQVSPVAQAAGLNLQQLNGIVEATAAGSAKTGQAIGEGLARVLPELPKNLGKLAEDGITLSVQARTGDTKAILEDILKSFNALTDPQRQRVIADIGGPKNAQVIAAALRDPTRALELLNGQTIDNGRLANANAAAQDNLKGALDRLRASVVALAESFLHSGLPQMLTDVIAFGGGAIRVVGDVLGLLGKMNDFALGIPARLLEILAVLQLLNRVAFLSAFVEGAAALVTTVIPAVLTAMRSLAAEGGLQNAFGGLKKALGGLLDLFKIQIGQPTVPEAAKQTTAEVAAETTTTAATEAATTQTEAATAAATTTTEAATAAATTQTEAATAMAEILIAGATDAAAIQAAGAAAGGELAPVEAAARGAAPVPVAAPAVEAAAPIVPEPALVPAVAPAAESAPVAAVVPEVAAAAPVEAAVATAAVLPEAAATGAATAGAGAAIPGGVVLGAAAGAAVVLALREWVQRDTKAALSSYNAKLRGLKDADLDKAAQDKSRIAPIADDFRRDTLFGFEDRALKHVPSPIRGVTEDVVDAGIPLRPAERFILGKSAGTKGAQAKTEQARRAAESQADLINTLVDDSLLKPEDVRRLQSELAKAEKSGKQTDLDKLNHDLDALKAQPKVGAAAKRFQETADARQRLTAALGDNVSATDPVGDLKEQLAAGHITLQAYETQIHAMYDAVTGGADPKDLNPELAKQADVLLKAMSDAEKTAVDAAIQQQQALAKALHPDRPLDLTALRAAASDPNLTPDEQAKEAVALLEAERSQFDAAIQNATSDQQVVDLLNKAHAKTVPDLAALFAINKQRRLAGQAPVVFGQGPLGSSFDVSKQEEAQAAQQIEARNQITFGHTAEAQQDDPVLAALTKQAEAAKNLGDLSAAKIDVNSKEYQDALSARDQAAKGVYDATQQMVASQTALAVAQDNLGRDTGAAAQAKLDGARAAFLNAKARADSELAAGSIRSLAEDPDYSKTLADYLDAQAGQNDSARQIRQARASYQRLAAGGNRSTVAAVLREQADADVADLHESRAQLQAKVDAGSATIAEYQALQAEVEADHSFRDFQDALASSQSTLIEAQLKASGDPVGVAQQHVRDLKRQLAQARSRGEDQATIDTLQSQLIDAQTSLVNTEVSTAEQRIQTSLDLHRISVAQAVAQLRALEQLAATQDQRDQIEQQILQLTNQANQQMAYNIPTGVQVPTLYEVRRFAQSGSAGAYQDNRVINAQFVINNGMDQQQAQQWLVGAVGQSASVSGTKPRRY